VPRVGHAEERADVAKTGEVDTARMVANSEDAHKLVIVAAIIIVKVNSLINAAVPFPVTITVLGTYYPTVLSPSLASQACRR
jgi:hypothetical protein